MAEFKEVTLTGTIGWATSQPRQMRCSKGHAWTEPANAILSPWRSMVFNFDGKETKAFCVQCIVEKLEPLGVGIVSEDDGDTPTIVER